MKVATRDGAGMPITLAFAAAKAAQRSLSIARQLWSQPPPPPLPPQQRESARARARERERERETEILLPPQVPYGLIAHTILMGDSSGQHLGYKITKPCVAHIRICVRVYLTYARSLACTYTHTRAHKLARR